MSAARKKKEPALVRVRVYVHPNVAAQMIRLRIVGRIEEKLDVAFSRLRLGTEGAPGWRARSRTCKGPMGVGRNRTAALGDLLVALALAIRPKKLGRKPYVDAIRSARKAIAQDLVAARAHAGLTRRQLAKKLRKETAAVARAESGRMDVSERYIGAVLRHCGLPPDWKSPSTRARMDAMARRMRA